MIAPLFQSKDNAEGNLLASISPASLTIVLEAGQGALFPTIVRGVTTSLGTAILLNATGIGASGIAVGDYIENVTDGSFAFVKTVSANSLATTQLYGGTANIWGNGDTYVTNRFVATLSKRDSVTGIITQYEQVLIGNRSGDTFTVDSRGYKGTTPASYDAADDYFSLFVTSSVSEGGRDVMSRLTQKKFENDFTEPVPNNTTLKARNAADTANIDLFKLLATNILEFQTLPRNISSRVISTDYDLIDKKYFEDNFPGTSIASKTEAASTVREIFENTTENGILSWKNSLGNIYNFQNGAFELGENLANGDAVSLTKLITGASSNVISDTYVDESNPGTNYDGANPIITGVIAGPNDKRALFKFNFAALPNFEYLISFNFNFNQTIVQPGTYSLFEITSAWTSATVTWATQPTVSATALGTVVGALGSNTIVVTKATLDGRAISRANIMANGVRLDFTNGPVNITAALGAAAVSIIYVSRDGKIYKADASVVDGQSSVECIGFIQYSGTTGQFRPVLKHGEILNTAGLTPGSDYFLSNTAGLISTTAGTYSRIMGKALSATKLLIDLMQRTFMGNFNIAAINGTTIDYQTPPGARYWEANVMNANDGVGSAVGQLEGDTTFHNSGTQVSIGNTTQTVSMSVSPTVTSVSSAGAGGGAGQANTFWFG